MTELSGTTQVAEGLIKELEAAANQQAQVDKSNPASAAEFQEVMDTQSVGEIDGARTNADSTQVLRSARVSATGPDVPAVGQSLDVKPLMQGFRRVLEDVLQGQNKLGEIIDLALTGRNFSTPELLALQAGVYRFTQEMEMMSKILEKATSTIKQTMNTQV
jgi:hypothetical protein